MNVKINSLLWQIALIGPLECKFDIEMLTYKLLVCDRQWRFMVVNHTRHDFLYTYMEEVL